MILIHSLHLDTNIVIKFLKGELEESTIKQRFEKNIIMISSLVEYELRLGQNLSSNRNNKRILEEFLDSVIILPVTSEIVMKASKIQAKRIQKGKRLPFIDLLIGTTAIVYNSNLFSSDEDMKNLVEFGLELV